MKAGKKVSKRIKLVSPTGKLSIVEATPYNFTIGTRAKWEMIVCDEEREFKKGEVARIKIQPVYVPEETIALPCAAAYHGFIDVLKIGGGTCPRAVEVPRTFEYADVIAIEDYTIHPLETIGILNLLPIVFTRYSSQPKLVKEE